MKIKKITFWRILMLFLLTITTLITIGYWLSNRPYEPIVNPGNRDANLSILSLSGLTAVFLGWHLGGWIRKKYRQIMEGEIYGEEDPEDDTYNLWPS